MALLDMFRPSARKVLDLAESAGIRPDMSRPLSFTTAAALSPILPPSLPFSGVTVEDALACPPVTRAVDLYTTTFLQLSWIADEDVQAWLARPVGTIPARIRDARTLQDLILHNRALWMLERQDGKITAAAHIGIAYWSIDTDGALVFLGERVPEGAMGSFMVIHGAKPQPFLDTARVTLQHYTALANTMLDRSETPIALHELAIQDEYDGLEPGDVGYQKELDPIAQAQKSYASARGSRGGAVTVTPRNVKLNVHQIEDDGQMLLGARNAVRKDVANFLNINASMLDGATESSDYSNTLQNRNEFLELSLALFLVPITERLSMDDITEPGTSVSLNLPTFDSGADARGNTGAAVAPLTTED